VNGALFDVAHGIVANEDDRCAKEDKRRPRFLTKRAREKAELMGRLKKPQQPECSAVRSRSPRADQRSPKRHLNLER
jgi:hypothetical protein